MTSRSPFPNQEYTEFIDPENFDPIFDKYGSIFYGIILRSVKNDISIAETLTRQFFVRIYHNRHFYDSRSQRLIIWMLTVLYKFMNEQGYEINLPSISKIKTL